MNKIKEIVPYLIIILVVIIIRTYIISPARVDGASMENYLSNGDLVLQRKFNVDKENLHRFDIIVLKHENDLLVKRIIGLPNEKIEYKNNILYINGKIVTPTIKFESTLDFEAETKNNEYFVLGDNRDDSKDSRFFGPVNMNKIKGIVIYRFYPFNSMGKID